MHTREAHKSPGRPRTLPFRGLVRLSADYRFTIPKALREKLGITPGQSFEMTVEGHSIVFTPIPADPIRFLRGRYKGQPSMTEELLRERARDLEVEESRIRRNRG